MGRYTDGSGFHGFIRDGATWTTIDYPGADLTNAFKINGANIVGSYYKNDAFHGCVFDGANWTTLDYPGAWLTEVYGISGSKAVGIYTEASGRQHGFLVNISASDTFASVGDYNHNGVVDAADYIVWRKTDGSTTQLAADGNGNHMIDPGDLNVWRLHFGELNDITSATGSSAAVPEPSALAICGIGLVFAGAIRWSNMRSRT